MTQKNKTTIEQALEKRLEESDLEDGNSQISKEGAVLMVGTALYKEAKLVNEFAMQNLKNSNNELSWLTKILASGLGVSLVISILVNCFCNCN